MKKIFIIFLFIIFSSSFSLANNNEKITVEEMESIFSWNNKWEKFSIIKWQNGLSITEEEKKKKQELQDKKFNENFEKQKKKKLEDTKRPQIKGIAKCLYLSLDDYWAAGGPDAYKKCSAKVVRVVFSRSEKAQKRRPGDIFYALDAITSLLWTSNDYSKFYKIFTFEEGDKPAKEMKCNYNINFTGYDGKGYMHCAVFKGSTYKKIEKFKNDPSNEKVLGHKLIKLIKKVRMTRSIKEKLGTDNYALLGDMLNATVVDVEKNNISPDLKIRRSLLKKYSLILRGIKKKLDEDKYKSVDKDVSKLSKTYEDLNTLTTTTNEMVMNIDESVDNIFDTNKLIQKSVLNSKDNEEEKLLALSSIYFMQSLIDSILSTIPEKYYVETKELSRNLFNDDELETLEDIIDTMMNKNKEIKSAELAKSIDIINKYINTSDVLKTLDNLGMKNSINRTFTQNTATEIVNQEIRDSLDEDIMKGVRKMLKTVDTKELSDLTKEASDVAKEVSGVAKEVSDAAKSFSILDKKFGNFTVKQLIGACRARGNC